MRRGPSVRPPPFGCLTARVFQLNVVADEPGCLGDRQCLDLGEVAVGLIGVETLCTHTHECTVGGPRRVGGEPVEIAGNLRAPLRHQTVPQGELRVLPRHRGQSETVRVEHRHERGLAEITVALRAQMAPYLRNRAPVSRPLHFPAAHTRVPIWKWMCQCGSPALFVLCETATVSNRSTGTTSPPPRGATPVTEY